jgi:ankyrin repeat protein
LQVIQKYVQKHPDDVNTRLYGDGISPLLRLCESLRDDLPHCLDILVRAGGNLYDEDDYGVSAAKQIAIFSIDGNFTNELSRRLAVRMPLTRMVDDLDLPPITKIILGIHAGDVRSYLSEIPRWKLELNDLDGAGKSPLQWTARQGDHHAVKQLLLHGADPNIENSMKTTPLVELARSPKLTGEAKVQCARLLIEAGADIKTKDVAGASAFYHACQGHHAAGLVELILDHEDMDLHETNSHGIIALGNVKDPDVIKFLTSRGFDIDFRDSRGRSSLMNAVLSRQLRSCRILLEQGADHTVVDNHGLSILHIAAFGATSATMDFLAEWGLSGVDPNAFDGYADPWTAMDYFRHRRWKASGELIAFWRLMKSVRASYQAWRVEADETRVDEDAPIKTRGDVVDVSNGGGDAESDSEADFEDAVESLGDEPLEVGQWSEVHS